MPDWNQGSVTDIAARPRFHREATPIWLATACTLLGVRAPSLIKPFRYADLGCGSGLHAVIVAATYPRSEVWGFDFNPTNIEIARNLAERAELTNIHFVEASFASMVSAELPKFDIMIAEDVLGVVSVESRAHIQTLISRLLQPGGLTYLGYDAETGWGEFVPLQSLMRILFELGTDASDFAIGQMFPYLDRLKQGGALYLQRNPILEQRIDELRQRPASDLAHTFLGQEWNPLMFAEVADSMAGAKCDFVGRATLHENIDAESVTPAMLPLLDEALSVRIRETMQDIAAATGYRRDIYRRGLNFMPVAEHRVCVGDIEVTATSDDTPLESRWPGKGRPDPTIYDPLMNWLRSSNLTIAKAHNLSKLARGSIKAAADAVTMLIATGQAHPVVPTLVSDEAAAPVARLNDAIIDAITRGEEVSHLVSPIIGAAIEANPFEILTIGALNHGGGKDDVDSLAESVMLAMRRGGRSVVRDGTIVENNAEVKIILREAVERVLALRVPLFRQLGILPVSGMTG